MPLAERVEAFFEREVKPHVPDAWIDTDNFNRYFYRYTPPRPLEEIDILKILAEVRGSGVKPA